MKRMVLRFAGSVAVLIVLGVGGLLLRNNQIEAGVQALKAGNSGAAIEKFTPLARFGDTKAQFLLGSMYAYGWGVPKSDADAMYWFRRAAMFSKGEPDSAAAAALGVAKSYAQGTDGVKVDPAESIKWLQMAATGGSKEAAALLAKSQTQ